MACLFLTRTIFCRNVCMVCMRLDTSDYQAPPPRYIVSNCSPLLQGLSETARPAGTCSETAASWALQTSAISSILQECRRCASCLRSLCLRLARALSRSLHRPPSTAPTTPGQAEAARTTQIHLRAWRRKWNEYYNHWTFSPLNYSSTCYQLSLNQEDYIIHQT